MTSKYAGKLRDANFGRQFLGLTLKDFELYDVISGKASGKADAIKNSAPEADADFRAALRATKKNLILRRSKQDWGTSSTASMRRSTFPIRSTKYLPARRRLAISTALTRKASSAAFRSLYPSTLKEGSRPSTYRK